MQGPRVVAIGGFESGVGKTTLLCQLLQGLPGWEAIKTTRGHYRSCGKDPRACCVSHLLQDWPTIRSGRSETYEAGKDTGRYWEAGAANVHWLIATDPQMEPGIKAALELVKSPAVLVEGNSFVDFVEADFVLMVAGPIVKVIKSSARRLLPSASALYLSTFSKANSGAGKDFFAWRRESKSRELIKELPIYTSDDLPDMIQLLRALEK